MLSHTRSTPLIRRLLPAVLIPLGAMNGCSTSPTPTIERDSGIAAAVGLENAVLFTAEGGPLNESGDGTVLTADTAIRLAVTTSPDVQAALARVGIALADADQARLLPNPLLNLIFKFPESGGKPGIEVELTADIALILTAPRRSSAADNRLRSASANAVTAALDAAAEVQERYAAVQALDELMPVLEERRQLMERLLRLGRDRLDAGEGTRSDVTTLESQAVELEVEIAEKRLEQRDQRLRLSRLIGRPLSDAAWTLDAWQSPVHSAILERSWVEAALEHRPEVRAVRWELAALGDEAALARFAPFEGTEAGVKADRDDGWAVGPSVSVPLPTFDTGQARRDRVTAEHAEARHRLTGAQRGVIEDVRRAFASLSAAQANLERVRTALIPLQEQRRSQAEELYRAGQTDVTALFLAEGDLHAALAKRVELEEKVTASLVRLQRAVGGGGVVAHIETSPAAAPSPSPTNRP